MQTFEDLFEKIDHAVTQLIRAVRGEGEIDHCGRRVDERYRRTLMQATESHEARQLVAYGESHPAISRDLVGRARRKAAHLASEELKRERRRLWGRSHSPAQVPTRVD